MNAPRTPATGVPDTQASESTAPEGVAQEPSSGDQPNVAEQRIAINPTAEYIIGNSDTPITGEQLLRGLGQAALARKFQANYDQASQRLRQLEPLEQENANLKAQLAQIQRRQEIAEFVNQEIPKVKAQQNAEVDPWDEDNTPQRVPQLDPNAIAEPLYNIATEVTREEARNQLGDVDARIQQGIQAEFQKQEQQRAIQQRNQQWGDSLKATDVNDFMENYGCDQQAAESIAGYLDQARLLNLEAGSAYVNGQYDASNELKARSRAFEQQAHTQLAKSLVNYEAQQERESLEQQLATGNFVGLDNEVPETPEYSKMVTGERKQAKQNAVQKAARARQLRRAAETKLGGIAR